jgi:hypothetical protein
MSRLAAVLLIAGLCAACKRPPAQRQDREVAAAVLHGVLAFPQSSVVNVASGSDAAQATFSTPAPVQTVATWYRQMLRLNGWELQSDAVMNDGSVAIFAQQGTRPLWITLKATVGGPGTTYTLIGTELPKDSVKDSLKDSAAQRSGSSMSSNRIQRR